MPEQICVPIVKSPVCTHSKTSDVEQSQCSSAADFNFNSNSSSRLGSSATADPVTSSHGLPVGWTSAYVGEPHEGMANCSLSKIGNSTRLDRSGNAPASPHNASSVDQQISFHLQPPQEACRYWRQTCTVSASTVIPADRHRFLCQQLSSAR